MSPVDVAALRRMAISEGGLLTDEIRRQVWPRLLNVPLHVLEQEPGIMLATYRYAKTEQSSRLHVHISEAHFHTVHDIQCITTEF